MSDIVQLRQKSPGYWWDFAFNRMPIGQEHKSLIVTLHSFTRDVIKHRMSEHENRISSGQCLNWYFEHVTTCAFFELPLTVKANKG